MVLSFFLSFEFRVLFPFMQWPNLVIIQLAQPLPPLQSRRCSNMR